MWVEEGVSQLDSQKAQPLFHNVSRTYPIQSRVFCYSKNKTFEDLKVPEIMSSSSPLPILNRSHPLGKRKGHRQEDFCRRVESLGQSSSAFSWEEFPMLPEHACGVLDVTDRLSLYSSATH